MHYQQIELSPHNLLRSALPQNERHFVIGDVHGCRQELETLLEAISINPSDRFYFLGDLVNAGPDSAGVLDLVASLPNTLCLLGNHELRLLNYQKSQDLSELKPVDRKTLEQLEARHWAFMDSFQLTYELPNWQAVLVHGGFVPDQPWHAQGAEITTHIQVWNPESNEYGRRSEFPEARSWGHHWQGPPFVFCGHTPRRDIRLTDWSLCIDTGCVYGGHLTAYELTQQKLWQVPAEKIYKESKNF